MIALALVATSCAHAPAAPPASLGAASTYGGAVHARTPVDINLLVTTPEKLKGKTVLLDGVVKDVCQGAGCWVEVQDANGASFIARSLDESILLPKDCKGQHIRLEGVVMALPQKVKDEKPEEGHACPKPNYVVSTKGVQLFAAK